MPYLSNIFIICFAYLSLVLFVVPKTQINLNAKNFRNKRKSEHKNNVKWIIEQKIKSF